MGQLYDLSRKIAQEIEVGRSPVEQIRVRGELATKAGFMVTMIGPNDADDTQKIASLRTAAREVLGLTI